MSEQLGIIQTPHFGTNDTSFPVMWFEVELLMASFVAMISWEKAGKLIQDADCRDVSELQGRGCACVVGDNGACSFVRLTS